MGLEDQEVRETETPRKTGTVYLPATTVIPTVVALRPKRAETAARGPGPLDGPVPRCQIPKMLIIPSNARHFPIWIDPPRCQHMTSDELTRARAPKALTSRSASQQKRNTTDHPDFAHQRPPPPVQRLWRSTTVMLQCARGLCVLSDRRNPLDHKRTCDLLVGRLRLPVSVRYSHYRRCIKTLHLPFVGTFDIVSPRVWPPDSLVTRPRGCHTLPPWGGVMWLFAICPRLMPWSVSPRQGVYPTPLKAGGNWGPPPGSLSPLGGGHQGGVQGREFCLRATTGSGQLVSSRIHPADATDGTRLTGHRRSVA